MPRRFQLLAMVAVLLAMPACASPATGSWTPVAEPPREEPIDRPHTSPDMLCSLEDAEMVSMVGTVLKPLPQVSDPGGATICRWSDGTDPGFSRFIQLAGMPSERIGDMIEATVAALEELGSTDPQVRQYEYKLRAILADLPELPTPDEGCEIADELAAIDGARKDGYFWISFPPIQGSFMGGKGAVVSLTRCDNWYLTVLWVGSRSWTRATVPTAKMTAAATMIHGRLSVD